MTISYLLVFLGLGIFALAICAMFWAIDSGQYDDVEAQGRAILDDEANGDAAGDYISRSSLRMRRDSSTLNERSNASSGSGLPNA